MAKRGQLTIANKHEETVDGYIVSDDIGIYQSPEGWRAVHLKTGLWLSGKRGVFKQKRQVLAYAEYLVASNINWQFSTKEEMFQLNDEAALIEIYLAAIDKGNEA